MLVPRSRLLVWVAVIVLPFALLAAIEPATTALSLLIIGALVAVALADAVSARASLAGLSLELPAVTRMSKEREGKLEVRIRNPRQKPRILRLALAWPPAIQSPQEEVVVTLSAESEWSRFDWAGRPCKRGNYQVKAACLETSSPLGFWGARKTVATQSEIRVYPNLAGERKQLAALFLHRGAFGVHAQRQIGQGRDFEKLREYIPGDSYDEIHWKATAKRGRPVTKVFQIERTQEVYVILDASRLSARPVAPLPERGLSSPQQLPAASGRDAFHRVPQIADPTTLERFITAALVLGLAAEQQGDLFGLLTFTNKVEHFVRAKNGKAHYHTCRDALYTLEPQIVTPDYDELCTFIRLRLRRRALLVFLTSLDDPVLAESFVRNLDLIRRQHLVLVNMLQPPGVAPVFTNPNVASLDDLYQHLGGHLLWQNLRELEKVLQRRGVRFSLLQNERL
ncbi:MAG TPA: DUF58 domain-containing protein, partial [Bacillota bacterium]|nr:DUF58 domain-containing protein [Bacillota bacterium]